MTNEEHSDTGRPSRRRLLGLLGGGAATLHFGTGLASADPGNGRGVGPCTCEEACPDGTFCGKVEGSPEAGETYTFSDEDDEYSVTIEDTTTKQDSDEVTCFRFSSTDDIQRVCIKGGPEIATYTGTDLEGELCAPTNPGGQQAEISNVSFCGTSVDYYQLDLVEGEPIENLDPNNLYDAQERLVRWVTVSSDGQRTGGSDGPTSEHEAACIDDGPITFDEASNVATVDVEVLQDCSTDLTLSLVGYRLPDGQTTFDKDTADQQTLVAADTQSFKPGEGRTLSIDLDA